MTQDQRNAIYPTCSVVDKVAPGACAAPEPLIAKAAPIVVAAPTAAPEAALIAPRKPAINAATMVAGLGIAAALGAAWYVYSQKKAAGA